MSLSTGWLVSTFSVIQEMCMVSACRDTAAFTIFGFNMGWFGIAYFSLLLVAIWRRNRDYRFDLLLKAFVFMGVGAEFRLLWIQKFIIGGWCPLCVTICCALFAAALLLTAERMCGERECHEMALPGWLLFLAVMMSIGFSMALAGVKALY